MTILFENPVRAKLAAFATAGASASVIVLMYADILVFALYLGAFTLFAVLLREELKRIGPVPFFALTAYVVFNFAFLLQMPFFSDDIYNGYVASGILKDFFKVIRTEYHYGRFPLNTYVVLESLNRFMDAPALARLFQYVVSFSGIALLLNLVQDLFGVHRAVKAICLATALSLPSSTENLIWFTSIHDNLALLCSVLSAYMLLRFVHRPAPAVYALSALLQTASIASSEIGYVLLGLHAILLLAVCQRQASTDHAGLKRIIILAATGLLGLLTLSLTYRLSYLLLGLSVFSSPYPLSIGLTWPRISRFVGDIYALVFVPFFRLGGSGRIVRAVGLALSLVALAMVVFRGTREQRRAWFAALLFLLLSGACALPYAVVAAGSLGYTFPRNSYLPGILVMVALSLMVTGFVDSSARLTVKELRLKPLVALCCLVFVCLGYVRVWSREVLAKIPATAQYVRRFESSLDATLSGKLLADSLVLFSFSPDKDKLVPFMRPYDYLQWVHIVIGYFRSDRYLHDKPPNVVPMTLDFQDTSRLTRLNVTLTGTYAAQFGGNPASYEAMIRKYGIRHIYHLNYDGVRLRQVPIESMTLYGQEHKNGLDSPSIR